MGSASQVTARDASRSGSGRYRRRAVWISVGALAVTGMVILAVGAVNLFLGPPLIHVGQTPDALVVTPDGRTLYVANADSGTVTPIAVATGRPGTPIRVGDAPDALVVTPDGRTLYAANGDNFSGDTVTPVTIVTGKAGSPIRVGSFPLALAVTPDSRTLYVAINGDVGLVRRRVVSLRVRPL